MLKATPEHLDRPAGDFVPCRGVSERHEHARASGHVPARAHGEGRETAGAREHASGNALLVSCVARGCGECQAQVRAVALS